MTKKNNRIIVNTAMTVLLPMLMAYSLIGEQFHEAIGTLLFVLFILHQALNRRWYHALFKGKYSARRFFQVALDAALLLSMILQSVSGILLSKYLYSSLPISGVSAVSREIHLVFAYWEFVLMCIHAGTHLAAPVRRLRKREKTAGMVFTVLCSAIAIYGAAAFVKRQFPDYMLRKSAFAFFDFSEPKICFFLDYLAIMILFAALGYVLARGIERFGKQRKA